ncbi:MAG: SBBP repeat-containing protein [Chitinophagaceae bacterium]|nr:SBBP repeat-containing protein [Chitinophagaceae bacterium]
MRKLLVVLLLVVSQFVFAQPSFEWAKNFGGSLQIQVHDMELNSAGYLYSVGQLSGNADFDPGPSTNSLYALGYADVFILKLDANANYQWAKRIGGNSAQMECYSMDMDSVGNIYLTGAYNGTVDFNPDLGIYNLTSSGYKDIFVCKLDSNGVFIWARSIGESINDQEANSVSCDHHGNVLVTGKFKGTVDFDPGTGVSNLTAVSNLSTDIYILKLDKNGIYKWARSFGNASADWGSCIDVDDMDNVYSTGKFVGTVDFDPSAAVYNLTQSASNSSGAYLSKLDSNGNFSFAKQFSGNASVEGKSLILDQNNYIYTVGEFSGTADFDPGISVLNITSPSHDLYISKLDSNGNLLQVKNFGAPNFGLIYTEQINLDNAGNIYISGSFTNTIDFDPSINSFNLTSNSQSSDIYVAKYNPNFDFVWAVSMGGIQGAENGESVVIDNSNNVFTGGYFLGTSDFDPSLAVYNLTATSNIAGFIQKLGQCVPSYTSLSASACNAYTLNGQTYTSSGSHIQVYTNAVGCDSLVTLNLTLNASTTNLNVSACNNFTFNNQVIWQSGIYYDTLVNSLGCDSLLVLNLNIQNPTYANISQSACDSYTLNGQTLTQSGIYYDTLLNAGGCDSLVTLNLTIQHASNGSTSQVACNSYIFNGQTITQSGIYADTLVNSVGCDSLLTLNLTINSSSNSSVNQTACGSYVFNGLTLMQSGTYNDTLINSVGCDSVVKLILTINNPNTMVTQNGSLLSALTSGATYQWINCPSFTIILGATNQTYNATANGDYAMIITQNGCTDTSICMTVTGVGIEVLNTQNFITISPNPTHTMFNIECPMNSAKVIVYNSFGQKLLSAKIEHHAATIDISQYPNGIYMAEIIDDKKTYRVKITKD